MQLTCPHAKKLVRPVKIFLMQSLKFVQPAVLFSSFLLAKWTNKSPFEDKTSKMLSMWQLPLYWNRH